MNDSIVQSLARKRAAFQAEFAIQEERLRNFQVNSLQDHFELLARLDQVHLINARFIEVFSQTETLDSDPFEMQEFERRYEELVTQCQSLLQDSRFNPDCNVPQLATGSPSLSSPHDHQSINPGAPSLNSLSVPNLVNEDVQFKSKSVKIQCLCCDRNHPIFTCKRFLNLSTISRNELANSRNLCLNCLRKNAPNHKCSTRICRHCNEFHHTSLHVDSPTNQQWTQKRCQLNFSHVVATLHSPRTREEVNSRPPTAGPQSFPSAWNNHRREFNRDGLTLSAQMSIDHRLSGIVEAHEGQPISIASIHSIINLGRCGLPGDSCHTSTLSLAYRGTSHLRASSGNHRRIGVPLLLLERRS